MSGWFTRIDLNRTDEATLVGKRPEPLFSWHAFNEGTKWVEDLVSQGKATAVMTGGYPNIYTSTVQHVLPLIASGPPSGVKASSLGSGLSQAEPWSDQYRANVGVLRKGSEKQILSIELWDVS